MTQPDRAILSARNRLLAMFLVLCTLDTTLAIVVRDKWAIGRILLTIVVMYFVLQGRKWAKWLLIGICSFLAIALITMILLLSSKLSTILIVGSSILAILSAFIPIYMLSSRDLTRYFSWKRQNYFQ
ncbi:hypothetical protein [Altericista sp. CCNU0014]|uniref:hypothetical protein n=1 Tax=Altericista sp. CCNU0014 TaxID=3082949 RepID=UPI00384E85C0